MSRNDPNSVTSGLNHSVEPVQLEQPSSSTPSRHSDGLQRSNEWKSVKHVLCVDYLPDEVEVDEIRQAFEPYARVSRVQFVSTRAGKFLGRAYVVVPTQEEAQRVIDTPLECGGSALHVSSWVPPEGNNNSVLFVRNVPPDVEATTQLFKLFSEFGVVSNVWCHPEKAVAHVEFNDVESAQRAYARSVEQAIVLSGNELQVTFSVDSPKRILHIAGFDGDEKQLRKVLVSHLQHVVHTRVHVNNRPVALVECNTVEAASRAKFALRERGFDVKFSRLKWLVRPSSTGMVDSIRRMVLHVSNVPVTLPRLAAIGETLAVKTESPSVTWIFDHDGKFSGRAFVHYDFPEEAALILSNHSARPFTIRGHQLELTTNDKIMRIRRPSRWLLVEGAPNLYKDELAFKMGEYGTVHQVRRGFYKAGRYVIQFSDVSSAVRAMEAHYLEPFTVEGRELSISFIAERGIAAPDSGDTTQPNGVFS